MKQHCSFRGLRPCAVLIAVATSALLSTPALLAAKPANAASQDITYSGRAIAFHVDGIEHPTAGPIVVCDTGALPSAGGVIERHASEVSIAGGALAIEQADASVSGIGSETTAETRLSGYSVHFITSDGRDVVITADFIGATADVSLNGGGHPSGRAAVVVQGLTVNGRAVAVTGAANQVVDLPEAEVRLVINEQVSAGRRGSGDVAVAAIHFWICECIEGHFGLVSAGISGAGGGAGHDCGKLTGGGWISGTPSGAKGTFGVSGGIRRGEYWGHLTYVDHGAGLKVESTAVTGFARDPADANARIITYNVTINGAPGSATVRVTDNGEPGRNDLFAISLSTGYSAGGDLGGSRSGGGNIQLHQCPPGWE